MKFLLLFFPIYFFAQNLKDYPDYPFDQHSFLGGNAAFYTDFHNILIQKNLKPCADKEELFFAAILIDEKGNATLFNDAKPKNEESDIYWKSKMYDNKCTINLIKEVMTHLEKWKWIPAKVNGKDIAAVEDIIINTKNLFSDNYLNDDLIEAQYKNVKISDKKFRDEINRNLDTSDFKTDKAGNVTVATSFYVNTMGIVENIKITKSSGSEFFDERFILAIKRLKKNWTPATVNNIPIKQKFNFLFTVKY